MLGHCHGEYVVLYDFTWLSLDGHLSLRNVQHGKTLIVPRFLLTNNDCYSKVCKFPNSGNYSFCRM